MVFQSDPMDFKSWCNPSHAFAEKQMSYPYAERNTVKYT